MVIKNSISRAAVVLAVLLIGVGLVLGADIGDSELLNPTSSAIQKAQSEEDIRHQQETNRLDEQWREAELAFLPERQRAQLAAELKNQAILTRALAATILALGFGGTVFLIRFSRRWQMPEQQSVQRSADILRSPAYQALKEACRTNEIALRRLELQEQQRPVQPVEAGANGRQRERFPTALN
jgi:hypothetical protein